SHDGAGRWRGEHRRRGRGITDGWDESREERTQRTVFIGNLHSTVTAGQVAHHVAAACGMKPLDVCLSRREDGTLERFPLAAVPSPKHPAALAAPALPA